MTKDTSNGREKVVGIWVRVSTEDQARGDSPEHHERRARYYADAKGWRVRELYSLEAVSGKSVMSHPEAQRMLRDVRGGHVTGLIFSKLARLARNTKELLEFADIFRECGADLISLEESIDTTSPAGRLFYTMIAAMAQWEREEIASRVAASVPVRARLGKSLGGRAPFGYRWHENQLVPDPQEAPVRRLMYELFRQYRRKKTVARLLNERGYRTRDGERWSDSSVARLLQDPTAKGLRRANYTQSLGEGQRWKLKPESEWVWIPVEAVVSSELWEECNAILDSRRASRRPPARRVVHLFSGLTHCHCGTKMYVPSNTPKYVCYSCRNKIPTADLEAAFAAQLQSLFVSQEELDTFFAQADQAIAQKEELLRVLVSERARLAEEMEKVYRLYQADQLSVQGFGERNGPLEARRRELEEEIPRTQAERDVLKIGLLSRGEVIQEARSLYGRWDELAGEEKREIVEAITERIVIGADEITIVFCYLPDPPQRDEARPRPPLPTNRDNKATKPQGFEAATSWKCAGNTQE